MSYESPNTGKNWGWDGARWVYLGSPRDCEDIFSSAFYTQQWENFKINAEHGFENDNPMSAEEFGLKLSLIHAELSEALEAYRKGDKASEHIPEFTGVEEEFADVIIRMMNMAQKMGLRLPEAMIAKQKFNVGRPFRHGDKRF